MLGILQSAAGFIASSVTSQVTSGLFAIVPTLRRILLGILIVCASFVLWSAGFLFGFLSLFFHLAELQRYLVPALWTSGASLVLALILTLTGIRLIRVDSPKRAKSK